MERKGEGRLSFVLSNAAECTVLLKKSGQFPLEKSGKIAAYGAGLRYTIKGGTGSGEVNSKETFTIEQGLERAGFIIASKSWLDAYDEVSIVCHESRELVVDRLIVELQLIELRELKVEIVVGIAI